MSLQEDYLDLQLQDSLGPELMKMLEDFGGVEDEAFGKGQAAVGSALDAALYGGLEPFPEDESGVPLPREPSPLAMKPGIFRVPSPVVPNSSGSGGPPDICPPPSAFQQPTYASSGPLTPPTPSKQLTQKPRSIRRARSSLAAHAQNRSESEPQELFMRRANSSELPDAAVLAKQGVANSPRSSSSAYVPFSAMNAVEVYPEEAQLMASGRRIKRRGSGRSSNDEMEVSGAGAAAPAAGEHSASCITEEADQATRVHKLLDAQKRAYEAKLEDSGSRASDLARQMLRLQMEKQLLEKTLQQVLESSPPPSEQQDASAQTSSDDKPAEDSQAAGQKVPVLFSPMGAYDADAVLLVSLAETPITLTAQQVTSMPWKQFVRLMKAYVGAIGQLLPEAEAQAASAAAHRAEQLGREAMYIGSCLAAGIPRHTRTLYCLKLQESGPEHSRAPAQLWAAIALQLRLSPAQRQEILRRRRAFLAAMAELLRRRRAIQASLASPSVPEGSIAGLSTDYLRTADSVERMQQNLDKDHSIVRRFTGGIVHQVLTPLQFARALVQSFPWTPDPLSIANCVAEAAGEPSAATLLSGRSTSLASISTAAASAPPPATAALSGDYSRLVGFANANAAFAALGGRPAASVPS
ncbi:hypothetical protein COCOBI_03-2840 [Coccomyxa sp. Obi]|nr:hypothetical protein COCOBI_03-2840 [Coccomyxa sp. Obi]